MKGYVKAHRKVLDSQMYKNLTSKQRDVFWVCIMLANHKTNDWTWHGKRFTCNPGQFITSVKSLNELTAGDTSTRMIRTALDILVDWQFLTKESDSQSTLITIINWDVYQNQSFGENGETDKRLTNERQTIDKRLTTNKNVKNEKNIKNYADNVKMTPEENQKLIDKFGELGCLDWIERLNLFKGSTVRKYKSDYMTILSWHRKDSPNGTTSTESTHDRCKRKGLI